MVLVVVILVVVWSSTLVIDEVVGCVGIVFFFIFKKRFNLRITKIKVM